MRTETATLATEIIFKIIGHHESHHGIAVIVENYNEGTIHALNNILGSMDDMRTRRIGAQDGYNIFENYTDSGSEDYVYFAIKA